MAFPQTKLPLLTEILVDGAWSEETRRIEAGLTITRGRRDWASRVIASRADPVFPNEDGRYSNRNPNSPLFGKLGRGTKLRHRIRWVQATFSGTASGSWSPTDTGQTWTCTGGTLATDYSESGGIGRHVLTTAGPTRNSLLVAPASATDIVATAAFSAVPTGGNLYALIGLADGDPNNGYLARLQLSTAGVLQLSIRKRLTATETVIVAPTTIATGYVAGTRWTVRLQWVAGLLRAAAWLEASAPTQTDTWQCVGADTAGSFGPRDFTHLLLRSVSDSAVTTVNPEVRWDNAEVNNYRMHGELAASVPNWDLSGKVVNAPFQAAGVLQRLSEGNPPKLSALRRTVLANAPVGYWHMEDESDTTQFASALDASAGTVGFWGLDPNVTVSPAALSTLPGSASVPSMSPGSTVEFKAPVYTETGAMNVSIPIYIPTITSAGFVIEVRTVNTTMIRTIIVPIDATGGIWEAFAQNEVRGGEEYWSEPADSTPMTDIVGQWILFELEAVQSTGQWNVRLRSTAGAVIRAISGTSVAAYGKIKSVSILIPTEPVTDEPMGAGHVQIYNRATTTAGNAGSYFTSTMLAICSAMTGHAGDTAHRRIGRVCEEAGVAYALAAASDTSALVGVQPVETTPEVCFAAAEADQGLLYEPRHAFGLEFRPRTTLYDQTGLQLDYDGGVISPPFQPTADGQILRNDVIAKRDNGSSARVIVRDGPLGTDAIGVQDEALSWNVYGDDQLPGIAGWRAHLGTWDEDRYPTLSVNFAAPDVANDPSLVGALVGLEIGDVATVINQPTPWMPPTDVALLAEGSTEWFGNGREWTITWQCTPAGPWRVLEYAADTGDTNPDLGRYEADSFALAVARDTTQTSWSVNCVPLFTTVADDFTPVIRADCEGEEIWITNATGAAAPQTLTVQRSKNGVVKSHGVGAPITLLDAAIYVP